MKIFLLLLIAPVIPAVLFAQAGSLDTTFSRDGKQITDFKNDADAFALVEYPMLVEKLPLAIV